MANNSLVIGNANLPPYFSLEPDKGLLLQRILPILNNAKLKYKILSVPASRAYNYMSKGEIDLWVSFKSPRYNDFMLYSKKEILTVNIQVCSLTPINYRLDDLKNKNLTVINGHLMGNLIYYFNKKENKIKLSKVSNGLALVKMLLHERSELIIGY